MATCSPPLLATLATGTACQTGVADFCPLFLRFGSPFWDLMGPGARKLRKWTPGGGVDEVTFLTFFHQFSVLGPLGAPGGPRGTILPVFYRFLIDFGTFFGDFSSIFHPCLAEFFRCGLPCTIHFASETGSKKNSRAFRLVLGLFRRAVSMAEYGQPA